MGRSLVYKIEKPPANEDELKKLSAMREQLFNIKIQMKMLKNIQGITYNMTLFTYLVQKKGKKAPTFQKPIPMTYRKHFP